MYFPRWWESALASLLSSWHEPWTDCSSLSGPGAGNVPMVWLRLVGSKHPRGEKGQGSGHSWEVTATSTLWVCWGLADSCGQGQNHCRNGGDGAPLLPQGSQELMEVRCSCECWLSLTPVSCSCFRKGGCLQGNGCTRKREGSGYSGKSGKWWTLRI